MKAKVTRIKSDNGFFFAFIAENMFSATFSSIRQLNDWLRVREETMGERYEVEYPKPNEVEEIVNASVDSSLEESTNIDTNEQTTTAPSEKIYEQWKALKEKHPDALLLFRCGDFYEAYNMDAKKVADILGITLCKGNNIWEQMCGFPHHALDTYLPKLIREGCRVAICDQIK